MITRADVVREVAAELDERAGRCLAEHGAIGARVADRLGLEHPTLTPAVARTKRWLFVRRQAFVPVELAKRFDGVIVATRTPRGRTGRSETWYREVRDAGVEVVTWEWMLPPGAWRAGLTAEVDFAKKIGAKGVLINMEPAGKRERYGPRDWRKKSGEAEAYVTTTRDLCDARGLELWATGWALPTAAPDFPWQELLRPCHVSIPQPYGVHGRSGRAYVERAIAEYRERGARAIIVGRGAHELDRDDDDAWRTPAEIREHRLETPPGFDEAWWVPAGRIPDDVVEAIVG